MSLAAARGGSSGNGEGGGTVTLSTLRPSSHQAFSFLVAQVLWCHSGARFRYAVQPLNVTVGTIPPAEVIDSTYAGFCMTVMDREGIPFSRSARTSPPPFLRP